MSLDDYLHGIWMEKAPSIFFISLFPFVLLAFRKTTDKSKLLFLYLKLFIIYNLFFSLMQFWDVQITSGSLFSLLPMFGVDRLFQGDTSEGLRITGAYASPLNIAGIAGFAAIVFYYTTKDKFLRRQQKPFRYILIAVVMVLATQTRAAFVGLVIAIILVEILSSQSLSKRIKVICMLSVIIMPMLYFDILSHFEDSRLLKFDDTSFLARVQINYFAILGTLKMAPFLGVPYLADSMQIENISRIIETGITLSNIDFGPLIFDFVTFHCEPAYYFRSYGLIGFILYLLFYTSLFSYIKNSNKHPLYKKALYGIVLSFFLFNLTHNGKIIQTIEIWVLLSLDYDNNITAEKS